jgi:hypothetical protein
MHSSRTNIHYSLRCNDLTLWICVADTVRSVQKSVWVHRISSTETTSPHDHTIRDLDHPDLSDSLGNHLN